jgi:hypothetical protein
MGKRQKSLFENLFDRVDDAGRDVRKVGRRAFTTKKRKKGGSRKWAKRTNRQLEDLTEQVSLLVRHLDTLRSNNSRDEARS